MRDSFWEAKSAFIFPSLLDKGGSSSELLYEGISGNQGVLLQGSILHGREGISCIEYAVFADICMPSEANK